MAPYHEVVEAIEDPTKRPMRNAPGSGSQEFQKRHAIYAGEECLEDTIIYLEAILRIWKLGNRDSVYGYYNVNGNDQLGLFLGCLLRRGPNELIEPQNWMKTLLQNSQINPRTIDLVDAAAAMLSRERIRK